MRLFLTVFSLVVGLALSVHAECRGANLFSDLSESRRESLQAVSDAQPFSNGNFWRATRGEQSLIIVGTYHLDDPRHEPAITALTPLLAKSALLLVEGGPGEEAALIRAMAEDPSLTMIVSGPTLIDRLPPDTWKRLAVALKARGIPGVMAAKLQPWYATIILAIAPCALESGQMPAGLDKQLMDRAQQAGIPIRALEPYDTLFSIFDDLDERQELDMIEASLAMEGQSESLASTLADLYFAGSNRLMWELMRELGQDVPGADRAEVDADMALMEERLMTRRNRNWIPVIDKAAIQGPVMVAFGALHLSGQEGVLNLLAQDGWEITPLDF